jgi:hypothetical protein
VNQTLQELDQPALPETVTSVPHPFPRRGWIGLGLILIFWPLNWFAGGLRTSWGFFPLWLGYALLVDGLAFRQSGTSLFARSRKAYATLFVLSAPGWWLFEVINLRVQNWEYLGVDGFGPMAYFLLASLNFSVVMPAVFGTAEWISGMRWVKGLRRGPVIRQDRQTTWFFFLLGWLMLALLIAWPRIFFPFVWLSIYFILEPLNAWRGNQTLSDFTQSGDWRPIISLWVGVLITGFFWEMWNFSSFPKWIYHVPGVSFGHVFEMPILGYGGYLPFSMELHALYFFLLGFLGRGQSRYLFPSYRDETKPGAQR